MKQPIKHRSRLIKHLVVGCFGFFVLSLGFVSIPQQVYAAKHDLIEGNLNVREVLKLDDTKQPTAYFDDKSQAPIESLAGKVINYALAIMGSIAVILMIIAGFMLMTAQGESTQIDKGKEIIKYAVIGLIVAFLSYIIVLFVQSLFTI